MQARIITSNCGIYAAKLISQGIFKKLCIYLILRPF